VLLKILNVFFCVENIIIRAGQVFKEHNFAKINCGFVQFCCQSNNKIIFSGSTVRIKYPLKHKKISAPVFTILPHRLKILQSKRRITVERASQYFLFLPSFVATTITFETFHIQKHYFFSSNFFLYTDWSKHPRNSESKGHRRNPAQCCTKTSHVQSILNVIVDQEQYNKLPIQVKWYGFVYTFMFIKPQAHCVVRNELLRSVVLAIFFAVVIVIF